ncbi:AP-4 complex accessory subunit RUSC2 isoform X2 [Entelurus aequoreus]|uniref:AP-4 complex accessory subunit RUSC2 isoform X2 n=1 Tax=Entelurus aequoreus TaxID=161455 RepID=UPI002B1DBE4C|nr:AP-4 complex accessory subunit RUSC2 isoform X2 [Entelurus aequoreus]
MDGPHELSGETLMVHHIPLVHRQVSGGSLKRSNPFSLPENLVLSRTTSLPERDVLLYSSLVQTSSGAKRGGASTASNSSFTSDEQLLAAHTLPRVKSRRGNPLRRNPFLLRPEEDEEEEEEEEDDLSGYREDSSFHLHTDSALHDAIASFRLHGLGFTPEPFLLHGLASGRESLGGVASDADSQRRHGSSGSNMSVDCGEQDWEEEDAMQCGRSSKTGSSSSGWSNQHCSCCSHNFPQAFAECQQGYASDSSCNSSDGVLVNFSAIYNKTNNGVPEQPAGSAPTNLNHLASGSPVSDPAFYLDLHTSPAEAPPADAPELDANCNSFCPPHAGSAPSASCLQSEARLVVATQNYYKLVTCDLSAQSSPSPAGSSVHSGSEEPSKGSPTPAGPSEYFLFREAEGDEEEEDAQTARRDKDEEDDEDKDGEDKDSEDKDGEEKDGEDEHGEDEHGEDEHGKDEHGEDEVGEDEVGEDEDGNQVLGKDADVVLQGRVYVNTSPPVGGEGVIGASSSSSSTARLRSRSCDRHLDKSLCARPGSLERMLSCPVRLSEGAALTPPPPPPRVTSFAEIARSKRRHGGSPSLKADPFSSTEFSPVLERRVDAVSSITGGRHADAAQGGGGVPSWCDVHPAVVRYSKDQRPTSLPIQPFTFHQQLACKPPQPKAPPPLLTGHMSGQAPPGCCGAEDGVLTGAPPLDSVRPSPLGSYSPVHLQEATSWGTCSTCTPSPAPPHHLSCPHKQSSPTPPPASLDLKRAVVLQRDTLSPLGGIKTGNHVDTSKVVRMHNGKGKQTSSDFLLDYFSVSERPPEEFCLSPDTWPSSSCSSSSSRGHLSVDMTHKRGLVKAVNTAVDLIVAHFGTSRDPDVKAKLGNSWVSPNVGHLILKYLCPALHEVLQDGLKAYVLDLIIGQRRCQPWSLVEASTQLGPSTRVLHNLFTKVSQFSELTSHSMRLNAFVFGLLNLKSLDFWFSHLFSHEDIIAAHYSPWGLLPLSHGACLQLYQELILLLQPLSLLPFHLDLLFEPHLLQKGQEQLRRKEQLCSAGQMTERSGRSTFQLMRGWSATVGDMVAKKEKAGLRREGTWPRTEASSDKDSMEAGFAHLWKDRGVGGQRTKGVGQEREDKSEEEVEKEARKDRQAGWWFQLMQSSQVYIDQSTEGSKFVKTEKRKTSLERRYCQPPPSREGVVEGAESSREGEGRSDKASLRHRGRPSWMGSPPESVLSQDKEETGGGAPAEAQQESPTQGQSLRWRRLFGSGVCSPTAEQKVKGHKSRPPSGWLGLDGSVLGLMAQTIGAGGGKKAESLTAGVCQEVPPTSPLPTTWDVRALCHHIASEPDQLSFNKGDVLRVLSKADPDWLLCSMGASRGLVPMVYVMLCSTEDSQYGGRGQSESPSAGNWK